LQNSRCAHHWLMKNNNLRKVCAGWKLSPALWPVLSLCLIPGRRASCVVRSVSCACGMKTEDEEARGEDCASSDGAHMCYEQRLLAGWRKNVEWIGIGCMLVVDGLFTALNTHSSSNSNRIDSLMRLPAAACVHFVPGLKGCALSAARGGRRARCQ